jgi:alcohol dehydrogenase (cytochrome c)
MVGTMDGYGPAHRKIVAYDAKTGKEAWRFYPIPAPGGPGIETWPLCRPSNPGPARRDGNTR